MGLLSRARRNWDAVGSTGLSPSSNLQTLDTATPGESRAQRPTAKSHSLQVFSSASGTTRAPAATGWIGWGLSVMRWQSVQKARV
jgi:hypothetical protein